MNAQQFSTEMQKIIESAPRSRHHSWARRVIAEAENMSKFNVEWEMQMVGYAHFAHINWQVEAIFKEFLKSFDAPKPQNVSTYVIELYGKKVWCAEIIGQGGDFGLERSFLNGTFHSAYKSRTKEIAYTLQNGKIYESCEDKYRRFYANGDTYETYEEAQAALKPTGPTQAEINRAAWHIAKCLNGEALGTFSLEAARKGSKKFLSQAMKFVHARIKAGTFQY